MSERPDGGGLEELLTRSLFGAWVIWYAVCLHAVWGVILLTTGSAAAHVTAINELEQHVGSPLTLGLALMGVGALAAASLLERLPSGRSFVLLLPQQFTLVISAFGALSAMFSGHFADGVARPTSFLVADQLPAVLAAALHTVAIIHLHLGSRAT